MYARFLPQHDFCQCIGIKFTCPVWPHINFNTFYRQNRLVQMLPKSWVGFVELLTSHTTKQYPNDTEAKDTGDDPECRNDYDDDKNNDDDDSIRLDYYTAVAGTRCCFRRHRRVTFRWVGRRGPSPPRPPPAARGRCGCRGRHPPRNHPMGSALPAKSKRGNIKTNDYRLQLNARK